MVHDKICFKLFGKEAIFYPKMVAPPKQIISHKKKYFSKKKGPC